MSSKCYNFCDTPLASLTCIRVAMSHSTSKTKNYPKIKKIRKNEMKRKKLEEDENNQII
jgi:hypothetical protein